jgi:GNAT superfamily N-acetyltransferase
MAASDVRELSTTPEFRKAFPVLSQLRDHLTEDAFLEQLDVMREDGYRLFALFEDGDIVAVAGLAVRRNFHSDRHVFVDDLVTDEDRRGEGHGGRLLEYVHELAREESCAHVTLESGLWRERAHEFYEAHGYEKRCYSFRRELDE